MMDAVAKVGLIEKDGNGGWKSGIHANSKEILVVGDVKTADNLDNFSLISARVHHQ